MDRAVPEPEVEPGFDGSIFEQLGFDKARCPHCNAHTRGGLCLNLCDLPTWLSRKFESELKEIGLRLDRERREAEAVLRELEKLPEVRG